MSYFNSIFLYARIIWNNLFTAHIISIIIKWSTGHKTIIKPTNSKAIFSLLFSGSCLFIIWLIYIYSTHIHSNKIQNYDYNSILSVWFWWMRWAHTLNFFNSLVIFLLWKIIIPTIFAVWMQLMDPGWNASELHF